MKFFNYINEAKFSKKDLKVVSGMLASVIGKKIGYEFFPFGGYEGYFEKFSKAGGGSGFGYVYVFGEGQLIRFNWESSKNSSTITSIDLWNSMSDENPYATLEIPKNYNVVQSVNKIVNFVKNPFSADLSEARKPSQEKVDASKEYDVDISLPYAKFWKEVKKKRKERGEITEPKARKASREQSTRTKQAESAEKKLSKKEYADPDVVFKDLEDLVKMVTSGIQKSLMVVGMAGIGKTYTVEKEVKEILGPTGNKWISMKGKSSPLGLYTTLYMNRHRLIVFDDMDSVFKDNDTINMLKAALDSTEDNIVTWTSRSTQDLSLLTPEEKEQYFEDLDKQLRAEAKGELELASGEKKLKLPAQFNFEGQVIFISNLPKEKIDKAILSRSFAIDVTLRAKDVFKRMESILPDIMPDAKQQHKREALDYLKTISEDLSKEANIRTLLNTVKCRSSNNPRWQHLAKKYA